MTEIKDFIDADVPYEDVPSERYLDSFPTRAARISRCGLGSRTYWSSAKCC